MKSIAQLGLFLLLAIAVAGAGPVRGGGHGGPPGGEREVYGMDQRLPGSGGHRPVLGITGSLHPGSPHTRLRMKRGLGGSRAWILVGGARGPRVGPRGMPILVAAPLAITRLSLGGLPGGPGGGWMDLPVHADESLAGSEFFLQVFVLDPGAALGLSSSNGLRIRFGDRGRPDDDDDSGGQGHGDDD